MLSVASSHCPEMICLMMLCTINYGQKVIHLNLMVSLLCQKSNYGVWLGGFFRCIESSLKKVKIVSFKITVQDNRSQTCLCTKGCEHFLLVLLLLLLFVILIITSVVCCCFWVVVVVCVCVSGSLLLLLLVVFVVCVCVCCCGCCFCRGGLLLFEFLGCFFPLICLFAIFAILLDLFASSTDLVSEWYW